MKKALIAMSGGVDSSVAASLMKEKGYECVGVTMKLLGEDTIKFSEDSTCCSLDDVEDARQVAYRLGMPHYVFNFADRFRECVIDRFVGDYEKGWTPNPCIECNRHLKFEKLFERMQELGLDYVVTGHYARIEYDEASGRYLLKRAFDDKKDQTYVLYSLRQEQLAHILFPLGEIESKSEARELAQKSGFFNYDKPDSQDICFVPSGKYVDFIREYTGKDYPAGDFVNMEGTRLGEHKGIINYTLGQRKGLGISAREPLYVVKIDADENKVILGSNDDLFDKALIADDMNWISIAEITEPIRVTAKVRYKHKEAPATVYPCDGGKVKVVFDDPQRAITCGQAVVLYDGDIVVGGGTIVEVIKNC